MNFLRWIFNFESRHYMDAVRYERYGKLSRILVMIFAPIILAFGIGCIYFVATQDLNPILRVFALIVALLVACACVEFCFVYSIFGFRSFVSGSLEKILNKRRDKRNKEKEQPIIVSQNENLSQSESLSQNYGASSETIVVNDENNQGSQTDTATIKGQETTNEKVASESQGLEKTEQEKKGVSKWLDLAVGIYCLVFALAGIAGAFVVFFMGIEGTI